MKKSFLCLCLCLLLTSPAFAAVPANVSALVQTVPLRHMVLANRITGYGTVIPEPGATENVNLPRAGQVTRLLVGAGQSVRKGQSLLELGPDPSGQMAFRQAENALSFAKAELERARSLFTKQLATRSQVDAAVKALNDAEQAWAAQNAVGSGDYKTDLRAPFDGLVVSVSVAQGDRLQAGANLLQLSHTTYLRAQIGIEPGDVGSLRPGIDVRVASVFDPAHAITGKIVQVGGQIDAQTQLVMVTVRFAGRTFLPGSRIRAEIAVSGHSGWAVPRSAVLRDDSGAYLFQVVGGKARRIRVETGVEDGGWTEVRGPGLMQAPVVSVGNYELDDGMAVREGGQ